MDEATRTIAPQPGTVIAPAVRASMRRAAVVLARQAAKKQAKRQLAARGLKLANYSHREVVAKAEEIILADAQHRAEIIAEAKAIVAVWLEEGFFGKRAALSVRNVPNYVHSTIESNANAGEMANDRGSANQTKPNTTPTAECALSAEGVSDRGGG